MTEQQQAEKSQQEQMDEQGHPMNVDPEAKSGFGDKLTDSMGDTDINDGGDQESHDTDDAPDTDDDTGSGQQTQQAG